MGAYIDEIARELDKVKKEMVRNEITDRIRQLPFRGSKARTDFVDIVNRETIVSSRGLTLFGPNYEDFETYLAEAYASRPWLQPVQAVKSEPPPAPVAPVEVEPSAPAPEVPQFDLDDISPTMTDEQLRAAYQAIRAALPTTK